MDINLLVIGVGNSRLHVGTFVAGELRHVRHIPHAQQADWQALLADVWKELAVLSAEIAGCSVVPGKLEAVEHAVKQATGKDVQWVGSDIDLPIAVTTTEPKQTGIDRVLVTAAAYEQLEKACVVVDAGTALTINLCNNEGALVGGAIAPGVSLMLQSLHTGTAKLPDVPFAAPTDAFGVDTAGAIRHGVTASLRGLVQTMAERWAEQMGTWPEVIATGGDAHTLFDDWEVVHAVSPDLLLYGIALAYTKHHIKHGT
ncbi:MAG: type III pantothenate kinase [Tepidisphaeraceae bacterium]